MRVLIIVALILLVFSSAVAVDYYIDGCQCDLATSCPGMRISTCPRGDFERIQEGCGNDDDYIEITLRNYFGDPVPGVPSSDYWITPCDQVYELCYCVQHIVADSLTGPNGRTTFSGRISAGGCVPTGGIMMSCQGNTVMDEYCLYPFCIDVIIVGPDINADCEVDLSDLSFFGDSYNKDEGEPGYDTCCDFTDNGSCDLSDFAFFGQHYLHQCF